MNSQELVAVGLEWLSNNGVLAVVLVVAVTPICAMGVVGYVVHVLGKSRGKRDR